MASLASLSSVVCSGPRRTVFFESCKSQPLIGSIVVAKRHGFNVTAINSKSRLRRTSILVCNCSTGTGLLEEQGESISLNESNEVGAQQAANGLNGDDKEDGLNRDHNEDDDDDSDVILKPAPKPLLKAPPKLQSQRNPVNNNGAPVSWEPKTDNQNGARAKGLDSELQGSASSLDMAIKEVSGGLKREVNRRFSSGKSVWRKGDPVKPPQSTLIPANAKKEDEKSVKGISKFAKPSAVPESPAKKVILRDVGATPKEFVVREAGPPVRFSTVSEPNTDISNPSRVSSGSSKGKDRRKKQGSKGGGSRRMASLKEPYVSDDEDEPFNISEMSDSGNLRHKRGRRKGRRRVARAESAVVEAPTRAEIIEVGKEGMLLTELAQHLAVSESEVIKNLFFKGISSSANSNLDEDIVKLLCKEYGVEVIEKDEQEQVVEKRKEVLEVDDLNKLQERPPVLTIMGHVDHGKTTLLDYIRKSKVTASEAGGITQGIGAYRVQVPMDNTPKTCVFLDTPGHEAFSAMRARGASVTDIVILVVAADDGVRPQTKEAIAHAKAANVPIVAAINKIDREGANPEMTMQELSTLGLMPEEWGGNIPMVPISALTGQNVNDLLETVMLVAELQELKANPDRSAKGTVIEATLHKSRGPLATFLVQNGTLKKGDIVVCGEAHGKVRALFDDTGSSVVEAGPSMAVQIIGLNNVPAAGEAFEVLNSLEIARERAEEFSLKLREARISGKAGNGKANLTSIGDATAEDGETSIDRHDLNIILKVDVQGSIEAIKKALAVLPQDSVQLRFLMESVGDVSAGDVELAFASEGMVVGFNVRVPTAVKSHAKKKNVEICMFRVIYDLVDDMRKKMEALLEPIKENVSLGTAEVKAVFSSGSGFVAGCLVTQGKVTKECGVTVIRKGKIVHKGILTSLRRVKEDVKEMGAGQECGIALNDFNDWEVADKIEAYYSVVKRRTLEEASSSMAFALSARGAE
eukprot:TRINITY_DN1248_c0_g1_i1.p1 TRINITY_DN1248_c0_g1~~TRINITY_DN1248_c0_g1_i1.p1  ORF type:complete len:978 (+),score=255.63 TRINITY_DN1248_c0_g1_i1:443-3376(+)